MKRREKKVLLRAESLITNYKDESSIYYKELKKSYREFREEKLKDKTTTDLYLSHIERLCDMLEQKNNAKTLVSGMIFTIIICIIVCSVTLFKYFNTSKELSKQILIANRRVTLKVEYLNVENFNALTLTDEQDYKNLEPLTLEITPITSDEDKYKVHYDIYIVEDNEGLEAKDLLTKDDFYYNATSNTRDSGIKMLGKATEEKGKLLIYSSEVYSNETDKVDIRMWLDEKSNEAMNKKYRFKINVDGYPVE